MSFNIWTPLAVLSEAKFWQGAVWRIVEAQHVAAAMKIVDSWEEQALLDELMAGSHQRISEILLDDVLAAPFRYHPLRAGSRFRAINDPGVFYGAESVSTAGAELAYWRWKFLKDAVDLEKLEPVAHAAFQVMISTNRVDLRKLPFNIDTEAWLHPCDYEATQQFARVARAGDIGGIFYQSVRDPKPAWCLVVLTPKAFAKPKPHKVMPTWWLAVYQDKVIWRNEQQAMTFFTDNWC